MLRIPLYYRIRGGASSFSIDNLRNTVLYNGGAYDTYATSDSGKTWRSVWDMKMFFIDDWPRWCIDERGRWFYFARLHNYFKMSLASDDAGATLRYLLTDSSAQGYRNDFVGVDAYYINPDALVFDATPWEPRRIFITTGAGRSFRDTLPVANQPWGDIRFKLIRPHVFGLPDTAGTTFEVDTRTGVKTPRRSPSERSVCPSSRQHCCAGAQGLCAGTRAGKHDLYAVQDLHRSGDERCAPPENAEAHPAYQ